MSDSSPLNRLTPLAGLLPFLRPYRLRALLALLALIVAAAATLLLPVAFRFLIDHGFSQRAAADINRYFLGLFGVAAVLVLLALLVALVERRPEASFEACRAPRPD